ncbi:MAG: hypothetical protein EP319_14460 [Deltaproteobacteria bacterium]|nr:MAG: hypothetical protein EP319_14460 [Deltaproteobacteria bacterium]
MDQLEDNILKIAWIGEESKYFREIKSTLKRKSEQQISWSNFDISNDNIGRFFLAMNKKPFNWVVFDFTKNRNYKEDLIKIIKKYPKFKDTHLIAIVRCDSGHDEICLEDAIRIPVPYFSIIKEDVDDIIEDIMFLTQKPVHNQDHFKTLGFGTVLWSLLPARYKIKDDNKLELSPFVESLDNLSPLKQVIKDMEIEEDGWTENWINQPDDFLGLRFFANGQESHFQCSGFKKKGSSYIVSLPPGDFKEIRLQTKNANNKSKDERRRVLIYDLEMKFFQRCWGKEHSDEKVNMYNYPLFSTDHTIVDTILPELIIINPCKIEDKLSPTTEEIEILIQKIKEKSNYTPLCVIFNSTNEYDHIEYDKLLKIEQTMTESFTEEILNLFINHKEFKINSQEESKELQFLCPKINLPDHIIYIEVPLLLNELSENYLKVICPFHLETPTLLFERSRLKTLFSLSPIQPEGAENGEYCGVFISESENQKNDIRRLVNKLNFTPKTLEQEKERLEFFELNEKVLLEREEALISFLAELEDNELSDKDETVQDTICEKKLIEENNGECEFPKQNIPLPEDQEASVASSTDLPNAD